MKKQILFLLLILINTILSSGQNIILSGKIIDSLTEENLSGVNIIIQSTNNSTISNEYGFFSISTKQSDTLMVIFSQLGYQTKVIKMNSQENSNLKVKLISQDIEIEDVTINNNNKTSDISTNKISVKTLQILPSIGGENDLMKMFKLMPGVQSAENKSSLSVRGGTDDQNLIIIDDVPLYYVNHLGGFVSVFNTDAINDISLIKGGFPARYGGRLSSVIDIKMKEGNLNNYEKNISVGVLSSKISIEGPIEKKKSSFMISARRFNLDLLTRPITYFFNDKIQSGYNFYDLNLKLNKIINENNRLFFSFYSGDDKLFVTTNEKNNISVKTKTTQNFKWGNLLFALRYNHIFSSKLFSNTTLSYTRYRNSNLLGYSELDNNKIIANNQVSFYSGIKDIRLNTDFQYFVNSNYKLRTGTDIVYHNFSPGQNHVIITDSNKTTFDTTFNAVNKIGYELSYYIENKIIISDFDANIGVRFSSFIIEKKPFVSLEPRINLSYRIQKTIISASYCKMKQNIHMLTFLSSGMPLKLWLAATSSEIPSLSEQYSLGVKKPFNKTFFISAELYYKKLSNLTTLKTPSSLFSPNQNYMENLTVGGKGKSFGIEVLIQKQSGKLNGWISYTYSKTTRTFEDINNGMAYTFEYDRPHSISIVGAYSITKTISFAAIWEYGTGFPYTIINQKYNLGGIYGNIYLSDTKNNGRMTDFHKLDISLRFTKEKRKSRMRTWSIDIYNVYNRKNASYYILKTDYENNSETEKMYKYTLFPIIPSISYSFKF
ncbi:MAG: TonB-dependent receptor [Bacteroidales bacterium]|nr:TonB-dependent receptor [Bacteroidales bacterium]